MTLSARSFGGTLRAPGSPGSNPSSLLRSTGPPPPPTPVHERLYQHAVMLQTEAHNNQVIFFLFSFFICPSSVCYSIIFNVTEIYFAFKG